MIVLDTHTLIWWVENDSRLPAGLRNQLDQESLIVPAIVCWEIAMLAAKGRIRLGVAASVYLDEVLLLPGVRLEPITPTIGEIAAGLTTDIPGDPADRLTAATAIVTGSPLATMDQRLRSAALSTIWD
ncbi:MAG TPA: type II toxin-antitoxin system VapC family toxin [Tepidiformaceae bacterium]|nr:type II toxin-antitoxin system VapC family toxin [Tepidiformaceae bacterium]